VNEAVLPVPVWAMPEDIAPGQSLGNGLHLDRGRGFIARFGNGLQDLWVQGEVGEFGHERPLVAGPGTVRGRR
jgi:hypothetical protein